MNEILQEAVYTLLQKEPYFAHFMLNSRIIFDRFGVETAGAATRNGTCLLIFNTEFFTNLTKSERVSIIKHEILHLLLGHTLRGKEKKQNHKLFNIALDCAINQYIDDLPEGCISLKSVSEMVEENLEPFQTGEYYYRKMYDKAEKVYDSGLDTVDDHELNIPGEESDAEAEASVKATASKALADSKGNISADIAKIVGDLSSPQKINWKSILRNFIAKARACDTKATRTKPHRRFDLDAPGRKKKRKLTLGVCIDTSGSISDEKYALFINEIKSVMQATDSIYIVQADSDVKNVTKLTKKTELSMERRGYGGTAYQPAITKCRELFCEAILYFGDLDTSDIPENPHVPVLWVTVGSTVRPGNFGTVLELK